ncbi:MAG: hypothetical protein AB7G11_10875, partial [Phycisphaerales bacterium]
MEMLEQRQLLAAVSWDGGGGDNLWHTAANWSNDLVPTAADDVTVDIAATPTILFNSATGSRSVQSLVLRENLTISGSVGLTVGTTAMIDGGAVLSLADGRIAGGIWTVLDGSLATNSNPDNRLSGLTWNGPISLPDANDRITFSGNVTIGAGNAVTLSGASAEIGMMNGTVLNGEINFPGSTSGRRIGATSSAATYTFGP